MSPTATAKVGTIQLTNDLLRVEDAAKLLDVHYATVYRWIRSGNIIAVKLGNIRFIPVSEVERLKG